MLLCAWMKVNCGWKFLDQWEGEASLFWSFPSCSLILMSLSQGPRNVKRAKGEERDKEVMMEVDDPLAICQDHSGTEDTPGMYAL